MDMSMPTSTSSSMTMSMTGMTMPTTTSTSSSHMGDMVMETMMVPWLHFTGGDNLFFSGVHPSSHGAIAGACIILGFLAIFERWVAGMRGVLERHWDRRIKKLVATRFGNTPAQDAKASPPCHQELNSVEAKDISSLHGTPLEKGHLFHDGRLIRLSPPFIVSHDVPRGVVFAFQAFLAYTLMLAVMTFQAAYIISIIVGLGIGEILFGRLGSAPEHTLH